MKTADQLLLELTKLLQIGPVSFDQKRLCGFLLDDKYRITLLGNSDEALFIYALLGEWPHQAEESFSMELMTANLIFSTVHGPYIGYDPMSKTLLLAKAFPLVSASADALKRTIEQIVQHQAHILKVFQQREVTLHQPPLAMAASVA